MPRLNPRRGCSPRCPYPWIALIALGSITPSVAAAADGELAASEYYRADPIPVPDDAPRERAPVRPQQAKQGVIFINFEGANLNSGYDDSHTDTTQLGNLAGPFAAYGQGTKREAVMQAVADDWGEYNVIVTQNRPQTGDYTMNMTGPTNPFGGGVLGIAPVDCFDAQTHNNITFAFHSANDQFDAATQATTIGQEVAHSYGLEHVDDPSDIMYPQNQPGNDPAFRDSCAGIVQQVFCADQHQASCGTPYEQNSHQELLDLFGASVPDTAAPTVMITYPQDGDVFPPGSDFEIAVTAADDVAIALVQLYNNGDALESDGSAPYGWDVTQIPEGTYELLVIARDTAENETMSNVVTITVGDAPPAGESEDDGGSDGGSDGGDGDGDGDGDGGDEDSDTESLPGGDGGGDDKGCGCSTRSSAPAIWLLLGLLPLVRRRRR